jgi:hypothetical protein
MRVNFKWGWVDVTPIPGYVQLQLRRLARFPQPPMETVSGLGGSEALPARPGSEAFRRYTEEYQEAEQRLEALVLVFALGAVTAWCRNDVVESEVPDDWTCPSEYERLMPRYMIGECPEAEPFYRKVEYLLTRVLLSPDDISQVVQAALNTVTQEAVEEAKGLFRSQTRGKASKK